MTTALSVRWDDFEAAFIIGSPDSRYFVNLDSGEVRYSSFLDDESVRNRGLAQTAQPHWVEIVRPTQADARAEVEVFIGAQKDDAVREALTKGYRERNPFMGFNKALGSFPDVRRGWATARMAGIHRRLLAFTKAHSVSIDDDRYRALLSPKSP